MRLINQTNFPLMLENGQQLAAAGTTGSEMEIDALSDADRSRLAGRVLIFDADEEPSMVTLPGATPATTDAGGGETPHSAPPSPADFAGSVHERGGVALGTSEKDARDSTGQTRRGGR